MSTSRDREESETYIAIIIVIGFLAGLVCYAMGYDRGVRETEAAQRQGVEQ